MKKLALPALIIFSLLAGSGAIAKAKFDFPTQFPAQTIMQQNYVLFRHDLSPLAGYHFKMLVGKSWKAVNVRINAAPKDNVITDVALFQIRDKNNEPQADLAIYVAKIPGLKQQPAQWLEAWLNRTFKDKSLAIVQKKVVTSSAGQQAADILFTYKYEKQTYVSRIYSFLSKGEMFIIQGTADEKLYNKYALNFFSAIASFDPFNRY